MKIRDLFEATWNDLNKEDSDSPDDYKDAEAYVSQHYPKIKKYQLPNSDIGFSIIGHDGPNKDAKDREIGNKIQSSRNAFNAAISELSLQENSYLTGHATSGSMAGYSWYTFENQKNGMAVYLFRDKTGNDTLWIAATDEVKLGAIRETFVNAGLLKSKADVQMRRDEIGQNRGDALDKKGIRIGSKVSGAWTDVHGNKYPYSGEVVSVGKTGILNVKLTSGNYKDSSANREQKEVGDIAKIKPSLISKKNVSN